MSAVNERMSLIHCGHLLQCKSMPPLFLHGELQPSNYYNKCYSLKLKTHFSTEKLHTNQIKFTSEVFLTYSLKQFSGDELFQFWLSGNSFISTILNNNRLQRDYYWSAVLLSVSFQHFEYIMSHPFSLRYPVENLLIVSGGYLVCDVLFFSCCF